MNLYQVTRRHIQECSNYSSEQFKFTGVNCRAGKFGMNRLCLDLPFLPFSHLYDFLQIFFCNRQWHISTAHRIGPSSMRPLSSRHWITLQILLEWSNQVKRACIIHGKEDKCIQSFCRNIWRMGLLGGSGLRFEDNIKMDTIWFWRWCITRPVIVVSSF
jgi:hypothetical protein